MGPLLAREPLIVAGWRHIAGNLLFIAECKFGLVCRWQSLLQVEKPSSLLLVHIRSLRTSDVLKLVEIFLVHRRQIAVGINPRVTLPLLLPPPWHLKGDFSPLL